MQPSRQDIPSTLGWGLTPLEAHRIGSRQQQLQSQQLQSQQLQSQQLQSQQLQSQQSQSQQLQSHQQLQQQLQQQQHQFHQSQPEQQPQQPQQQPQQPQQQQLKTQLPQLSQLLQHSQLESQLQPQQSQQQEQLRSLPRHSGALFPPIDHFQASIPYDKPDFSIHMAFDEDSDDQGEQEGVTSGDSQLSLSPDPKLKRKAQNRAAQRAFRERRQVYVKQLEEKNREQYRNHIEITRRLQSEIAQLRATQNHLQVENNLLKSQAAAFMFDRSNSTANTAQRNNDNSTWIPSTQGQDFGFDLLSGAQPSATPLPVIARLEESSNTHRRSSFDAQKVPSPLEAGLTDMVFFAPPSSTTSVAKSLYQEQMAEEVLPNFSASPGKEGRSSRGMEAKLRAWKKMMESTMFDEMDGEQLRKEFKIIARIENVVSESDGDNLVPQRLRN